MVLGLSSLGRVFRPCNVQYTEEVDCAIAGRRYSSELIKRASNIYSHAIASDI